MATEDILINDGDSFVSLSALAAEQVDATLPIQSDDGTVVLDSPSANTFTVSTGGAERVAVSTTDATFSVPVRTSTVKGLVDTDASIDLNADVKIKTAGDTWTFRSDGCLGVGYPGQADIHFILFQDFNDSPRATQWDMMSAPKFNKHATDRCVGIECQPLFGSAGNELQAPLVSLFNANSLRSGSVNFDGILVGYDCEPMVRSRTQNVGFRCQIASSAGGVSANNYSFLASGNAPSRFVGGLQTYNVKGLVDTDASIDMGAELRTINHTPTQPDSIATKKIVDDKIWVGTTAEYLAIPIRDILPTTLYCLTD